MADFPDNNFFRPPLRQESSSRIRIVLADNCAFVRIAVSRQLQSFPDLTIIGEASCGDAAIRLVCMEKPDVLVTESKLPGIDAITVVRQCSRLPKPPHVLVVSAFDDPALIQSMLSTGVDGYLLKNEGAEQIVSALYLTAKGISCFSQAVISTLQNNSLSPPIPNQEVPAAQINKPNTSTAGLVLSSREQAILRLLTQERNNYQIAEELALSEGTVRNYISELYRKLKTRSRVQLAIWAWQNGIAVSE